MKKARSAPPQPLPISLVLGSGGARGLAHIGVIRELESRGYDIRAISGSSMGALVGGIHALGGLDAYEKWVTALGQSDMLRLLDLTLSGGGLIRGEVLIQRLRELVGECNIEDAQAKSASIVAASAAMAAAVVTSTRWLMRA